MSSTVRVHVRLQSAQDLTDVLTVVFSERIPRIGVDARQERKMAQYQVVSKDSVTPLTEKASAAAFFGTAIEKTSGQSYFRVSVQLGSSAVFGYKQPTSLASTLERLLNGGAELPTGCEYEFSIYGIRASQTVNFFHKGGASTSIDKCDVEEVFEGGVY